MKKPNEFIEVFMSLIKLFLIILLLNNAIWGIIFYKTVSSSGYDVEQDGHNNIQEVGNVSTSKD
jgi:hypothetical protein